MRPLINEEPFWSALQPLGYGAITDMPRGAIVAVANLHKVGIISRRSDGAVMVQGQELPIEGAELDFGNYTPGRYGWVFTNIWRLDTPVPARGALGLWTVPPEVEAEVRRAAPRWAAAYGVSA